VTSGTKQYLESTSVVKLLDMTVEFVMEKPGVMSLNQLSEYPRTLKRYHSSPLCPPARTTRIRRQAKGPPAVSPYFVVRKEGWAIIEQKLLGPRAEGLNVFVISGMGGCGKTQMVSYFVPKHHQNIKADLRNAIRLLDGHQQDSEHEALLFLQSHSDSLLIFDNADNPKVELVPFFPRLYRGIILITTRVQTLRSLSTLHHLELGPMSYDEAIGTLVKASGQTLPLAPNDVQYVDLLIKELGCLALALVQAGIYIVNISSVKATNSCDSVFGHYLGLFRRERAILMRKEGTKSLDQYKRGVYPTLDLSYSLLSPSCRDFLHLCSQLHYTNISLAMVLASMERKFEDQYHYLERHESHKEVHKRLHALLCSNGGQNELHVHDMIQSLASLSLVQTSMVNNTILLRFHPLIHSWAHEMLPASSKSMYNQMAITLVSTCKAALSPAHVQYLPLHMVRLVDTNKLRDLHARDMIQFGKVLGDYGFGRVAIELHEEAVKRIEMEAGRNDNQIISGSTFLGSAYVQAGRLKEAEKVEVKVLEMQHKKLGEWHPDTILASNNLADTYYHLGKLKEAEELQIKVLEMRKEILGEQHPDTIKASNNLANTYCDLGKLKEAEELQIKVLEMRQEILGEQHPHTIQASNNLAITYQQLGRLIEAKELCQKAYEPASIVLGENHPTTVWINKTLVSIQADIRQSSQRKSRKRKRSSTLDSP
ncbi:16315_t:CDS:2, partial [Acaulospora colombiana]